MITLFTNVLILNAQNFESIRYGRYGKGASYIFNGFFSYSDSTVIGVWQENANLTITRYDKNLNPLGTKKVNVGHNEKGRSCHVIEVVKWKGRIGVVTRVRDETNHYLFYQDIDLKNLKPIGRPVLISEMAAFGDPNREKIYVFGSEHSEVLYVSHNSFDHKTRKMCYIENLYNGSLKRISHNKVFQSKKEIQRTTDVCFFDDKTYSIRVLEDYLGDGNPENELTFGVNYNYGKRLFYVNILDHEDVSDWYEVNLDSVRLGDVKILKEKNEKALLLATYSLLYDNEKGGFLKLSVNENGVKKASLLKTTITKDYLTSKAVWSSEVSTSETSRIFEGDSWVIRNVFGEKNELFVVAEKEKKYRNATLRGYFPNDASETWSQQEHGVFRLSTNLDLKRCTIFPKYNNGYLKGMYTSLAAYYKNNSVYIIHNDLVNRVSSTDIAYDSKWKPKNTVTYLSKVSQTGKIESKKLNEGQNTNYLLDPRSCFMPKNLFTIYALRRFHKSSQPLKINFIENTKKENNK